MINTSYLNHPEMVVDDMGYYEGPIIDSTPDHNKPYYSMNNYAA